MYNIIPNMQEYFKGVQPHTRYLIGIYIVILISILASFALGYTYGKSVHTAIHPIYIENTYSSGGEDAPKKHMPAYPHTGYFGSKNSKVAYSIECISRTRIKAENLVFFSDVEEVSTDGYTVKEKCS